MSPRARSMCQPSPAVRKRGRRAPQPRRRPIAALPARAARCRSSAPSPRRASPGSGRRRRCPPRARGSACPARRCAPRRQRRSPPRRGKQRAPLPRSKSSLHRQPTAPASSRLATSLHDRAEGRGDCARPVSSFSRAVQLLSDNCRPTRVRRSRTSSTSAVAPPSYSTSHVPSSFLWSSRPCRPGLTWLPRPGTRTVTVALGRRC